MSHLARSARFFVNKTATQTFSNRTLEVLNWDASPLYNTPGFFAHSMASAGEVPPTLHNALTILVPGIYLMTCDVSFDTPAATHEWNGLWLYRNNAGTTVIDKYLHGTKAADGGQCIYNCITLVKVTQADIDNGDNVFQIMAYYAEVVGVAGSGASATTYWDTLFLDKL
jgi:hypothetical protein